MEQKVRAKMDAEKVTFQDSIASYFRNKVNSKSMDADEASKIMEKSMYNICSWLKDNSISSETKEEIQLAIDHGRWDDLIYAFWQEITFGTGGIRGRAALTESELVLLASKGLSAKILKGPNTINDVVFARITNGVANYMEKRGMRKVIIGYDSRIRGKDFSELIARIFLAKDFKVHLFDEATPYPELSYAVTYLRADIGIEISASHNDKRYNGYKICTNTGASLNLDQRQEIVEEIYGNEGIEKAKSNSSLKKPINLKNTPPKLLTYLGGSSPLFEIGDHSYINIHREYLGHIKDFVLRPDVLKQYAPKMRIGYCAYYGSGHKLVPWLLREMGFNNLQIVTEMNKPDGLFPSFKLTQLPDPGFVYSAMLAVDKFKEEHGNDAFEKLDMFIGTDPDADRMGLIVNIPKERRAVCGNWKLLTANDLWTLVLWYRLSTIAENNSGTIPDAQNKFIVKSHVTTEALRRVARKFNVACLDTWVGFGFLAEKIIEEWGKGRTNLGAFEESNGFTIGGAKPRKGETLGRKGHTLEKDGTLAAILTSEICAFAKSQGASLMDLLNNLYLDPDVGCFATVEITLPEVGVFEGVEGELLKRRIIKNIEKMSERVNRDEHQIDIAEVPIVKSERYATSKYDNIYWKGFPDEGIRFYFDHTGVNHITIRPSGTEAKLRFYVQYKIDSLTPQNIWEKKTLSEKFVEKIAKEAIHLVTHKQF
jgi:phosphoglucomutase